MINIPVVDKNGNIERERNLEEKCEVMFLEALQGKIRTYTPRQLLTLYNWWRDRDRDSYYLYPEVGDTIKGEILRRMEGNKAILIPNADCGECEVELHTAI